MERVVHAIIKNIEQERARDDPIRDCHREQNIRELGEWKFESCE